MCGMKTVFVFVAFLVAARICIYKMHIKKKMGEQSKNKIEKPCESEHTG